MNLLVKHFHVNVSLIEGISKNSTKHNQGNLLHTTRIVASMTMVTNINIITTRRMTRT